MAEPDACKVCAARTGINYFLHSIPERPHPNCKCKLVLSQSSLTVPTENRWYPDFEAIIMADCTMITVGEIANFVQFRCDVTTSCIPKKRLFPKVYKRMQHKGVYEAYMAGPGVSLRPISGVAFRATFPFNIQYEYGMTPLHALEGWANIAVAGNAFIVGGSISRIELGSVVSSSVDFQVGFDMSAGWYGGYGSLLSYETHPCEIAQEAVNA